VCGVAPGRVRATGRVLRSALQARPPGAATGNRGDPHRRRAARALQATV
jgi:hypothetical protein